MLVKVKLISDSSLQEMFQDVISITSTYYNYVIVTDKAAVGGAKFFDKEIYYLEVCN